MNSQTIRKFSLALAVSLVCLTPLTPVRAALSGLINTGTDVNGSLLPFGSVQPGWTITGVNPPNPPGGLTPATPPYNTYVVQPYYNYLPVNPGDASQWISYSYPLCVSGDNYRLYAYQLSFQAAQGDSFYMRVAVDNAAQVSLAQTSGANQVFNWGSIADWGAPGSLTPLYTWSPWTEVSGLQNGDNTLTCLVANWSQNYLNPAALRVEFSLIQPQGVPIVPIVPVPEPSTYIAGVLSLLPFGASALRIVRRNRKQTA